MKIMRFNNLLQNSYNKLFQKEFNQKTRLLEKASAKKNKTNNCKCNEFKNKIFNKQSKKAQNAIEFLSTYAWAFIVIALVLVVLSFFINRPLTSNLSSTCTITPLFPCTDTLLSSYNSTKPITFQILFTNDFGSQIQGTSILFPGNAINVSLSNIGQNGTNAYKGNCYPNFATYGSRVLCSIAIPGKLEPSKGTMTNAHFAIAYKFCNGKTIQSCTSGLYNVIGYSSQNFAQPIKFNIIHFIINSPGTNSSETSLNGVLYKKNTSVFLLSGKYSLFPVLPNNYKFLNWNVNGTSAISPSNSVANASLSLNANATLTYYALSLAKPMLTIQYGNQMPEHEINNITLRSNGSIEILANGNAIATGTNSIVFNANSLNVGNYNITGFNENTTVYSNKINLTVYALPTSIEYFVPITLTNSQTSQTPALYQFPWGLSVSQLSSYGVAGNAQNIEFFYANGTIIPSWLEYLNTSDGSPNNYTYGFLKFNNSLPAPLTSIIIYMGIASKSTNLLNNINNGEAPQLSTTYAQYDDGANVFPIFYQNFAGTSLNSIWHTYGSPTISVNNGLTLGGSGNSYLAAGSFSSGDFMIYQKETSSSNSLDYGVMLDYNYSSNTGYLIRSSGLDGTNNVTWWNDNNNAFSLLGLLHFSDNIANQVALEEQDYVYNNSGGTAWWNRNSEWGLYQVPGSSNAYNKGSVGFRIGTTGAQIYEQWVLVRQLPPSIEIIWGNLQ